MRRTSTYLGCQLPHWCTFGCPCSMLSRDQRRTGPSLSLFTPLICFFQIDKPSVVWCTIPAGIVTKLTYSDIRGPEKCAEFCRTSPTSP